MFVVIINSLFSGLINASVFDSINVNFKMAIYSAAVGHLAKNINNELQNSQWYTCINIQNVGSITISIIFSICVYFMLIFVLNI